MLSLAISMACKAHICKFDKANQPYITHPMRVMLACEQGDAQICAVLHDVIEDSDMTLADLRAAGFSEDVVAAVDALSKREEEMYDEYIQRLSQNQLASRIKLADLCDNVDLNRIPKPSKKDIRRVEKYTKAAKFILKYLKQQNAGQLVLEIPEGDYGDRLKDFIKECSK